MNFSTKVPPFNPKKKLHANWKTWRKGLNLLLRPTELNKAEMAKADNILLDGSGVPKGRWGTVDYFTVNATGSIRGIGTFIDPLNSINQIFALSDQGYLAKKNGSDSTQLNGQSWPSGSIIRTEQLGGETHIVSKDVSFTKYDGTDLTAFATISSPTGLSASNFSGATGYDQTSYKIVAVSPNGGTTTPSDNYLLTELPSDLGDTSIHVYWTAPSAASLSGFEVYRGGAGDETFLAAVDGDTTFYVDKGKVAAAIIEPPITNTTGGVKSQFIKKFKDRLLTVDKDDPNKLMISGRYPNHTSFSWQAGGGFIYVDPDSGDNITGIEVQPIADRIVVYKNQSSYLVKLNFVEIVNFLVLDPSYEPISTAVGCSSQDSIATVENDTFYFGRDGIYVTGYEPNFLNILRTNEISARIRPEFEGLSESDLENSNAIYVDNKYILSLPTLKKMIVYDRERGAFAGIWKMPFGIRFMKRYFDGDGTENWVLGSYDSNQVYTFEKTINTDDGTAILKTMRTKKEDFGDWTILNILTFFYIQFSDITGDTTVNIIVEDRDGNETTVKTFTISGSEVAGKTGWGMDRWGNTKWGQSESTTFATAGNEITRWGSLFKQSRLVQLEITSPSANSNFALLAIKLTAMAQTEGALASQLRV